jgi:hypothetical protein
MLPPKVITPNRGKLALALNNAYREAARKDHRLREGDLEVDENAKVSRDGEDDIGAYVQAWIFVRNEDAGIRVCVEEEGGCGLVAIDPSDSGDWYGDLCPSCADKKYSGEVK